MFKKILTVSASIIIFLSNIETIFSAVSPEAPVSTFEMSGCMDDWSEGFNLVDQKFMSSLESIMQQSGINTSDLVTALPPLIRSYRCNLKSICHIVQNPEVLSTNQGLESAEASKKNKTDIDGTDFKDKTVRIFGCADKTIRELKDEYGEMKTCIPDYANQDRNNLFDLYATCDMHAEFKIEQMKIAAPAMARKDANRKQMGFMSLKIKDLRERMEIFLMELTTFHNKFTKIIDSIQCIVMNCKCRTK